MTIHQTFFLIFIVTLSSFSRFQSVKTSDKTFFSELKNTEFGQTLFKSIQLQIKMNKSVDSIISMLQKMRSNLLEEDADDLAQNEADQSDCASDSAALTAGIQDAKSQFDQDQRDIRTDSLALESVQEQLDLAQSSKSAKETQLSDLQNQRNQERAAFESNQADISNALTTLYNGKLILKQLLQDSEANVFLQTKKGARITLLMEFANTLRENSVAQPGLRGLMNYFSQLFTNPEIQADQDVVQKVLDLIELLISKLDEESSNEQSIESVRGDVFQKEQLELDSEITQLASEIVEVSTGARNLNDNIENLKQDTISQEQIQKEKSDELDIRGKSCRDSQRAFEDRSQKRKDEIKIIQEAVEIFKNRFDNVKDFLSQVEI